MCIKTAKSGNLAYSTPLIDRYSVINNYRYNVQK